MKKKFIITTSIIALLQLAVLATSSYAQDPDLRALTVKQAFAAKPKVAYMGAVAETKGATQYHKIVLQVTNRSSLSRDLFMLPPLTLLPPNPCKRSRTRLVAAVYDELGPVLSSCMPIGSRDDLGKLSFLIEKGKTIPKFVYVVLTDLKTAASYKSNFVSPLNGETK